MAAPIIPAREWLGRYSRAWLSADLIAGATGAAVVLPQAMAYASLAGLPVENGLYTALLMLPLYALLGTSRILSVTVTSPIALLTATAVAPLVVSGDAGAYGRAAATLAVMVGLLFVVVGLLRLGFLANFISLPVLTGFKFGMGLLIASSQLGKLFGIPFQSTGFLRNIYSVLQQWAVISLPTLGLSLVTIAVMLALVRRVPRLPAALVSVAMGISLIWLTDFERRGVALIAPVPSGLPAPVLPDLAFMRGLWASALGIVLMSAIESVSVARTFARAQDPRIDTNRELVAIGVANLGAGLFQGFPGGGGTSQTAVNAQFGAKTQLSGLVTCGIAILSLTLLAPVLSLLPQATLGATVFVAALGLLKLNAFRRIAAVRRRDALLAILAALTVLFLGPLQGILVAVGLSILTLLYEINHPQIYVLGRKHGTADFRDLLHNPHDEIFPGLLIVHPVGRIYFANVDRVHHRILELIQNAPAPVKILLVDASTISDLEYTVLEGFDRMGRELEGYGVKLWLAALNPKPLEMVLRFIQDPINVSDRLFISVHDGVEAYLDRYPSAKSEE